ncbi:MAG TPA: HAD-IA family hydrolase [Candidatus Saccharimonadales bacterium]|nr:HAD-IA family hydrolase [Candidatus Saccharimonadales bacterium]
MKTVIFDFDGTLADSLDVIVEIFEQLTGKRSQLSREEMAGLRHLPIPAVGKRLGLPMWKVPYLLWRGKRMMAKYIEQVPPYSGVEDVLKDLQHAGYQIIIVSSNSRANVRIFLKHYGLSAYFHRVYGNVGLFSKAAALRKILARNHLHMNDCVYIGDETRDVEACQSIGLRIVAAKWGFADPVFLESHNPTALAGSPKELIPIISKLFAEA